MSERELLEHEMGRCARGALTRRKAGALSLAAAGAAVMAGRVAAAQDGPAAPPSTVTTPPRDFGPNAPPNVYFIDPDIVMVDPAFGGCRY